MKKAQAEAARQAQQLELLLRELQERLAQLESGRLGLEQDNLSLQSALETEKRERSLSSESINDLQGKGEFIVRKKKTEGMEEEAGSGF